MIRTIMSFFGYVKIPKAVIQLSLRIQGTLEMIEEGMTSPLNKKFIGQLVEEQKTLTSFLRSGRL